MPSFPHPHAYGVYIFDIEEVTNFAFSNFLNQYIFNEEVIAKW
jgi:hypothetical protein